MRTGGHRYLRLFELVCGLITAGIAFAQPVQLPMSAEELTARIEAVNASTSLDEAVKAQILDSYNQARDALTRARDWQQKVAEYEAAIAEAPEMLRTIEQELATNEPVSDLIDPDATLQELDQQLIQTRADLVALKDERALLQAEPQRRDERRSEISTRIASARSKIQEIQTLIAAPYPEGPEEAATAYELALSSRLASRQLELAAYEKELQMYEVRSQLLTQRIARANRQFSRQEQLEEELSSIVSQKRQQEARVAAAETRQMMEEVADFSAGLRAQLEAMLEENAALNARRIESGGLLAKINSAESELSALTKQLEELRESRTRVEARVAAAGSSTVAGLLLRQQADKLPSTRVHQQNVRERQVEIAEAQIQQIEIRERLFDLADLETAAVQVMNSLSVAVTEERREQLSGFVHTVLEARRKSLDSLLRDYETYFSALVDLDLRENELIQLVQDYSEFIAEHVLFIKSGEFPSLSTFVDGRDAVVWLLRRDNWTEVGRGLARGVMAYPAMYLMGFLVVGLLFVSRGRVRTKLMAEGERAAKATCTNIGHTAYAILYTLLLSMLIPVLLFSIGFALTAALTNADLSGDVGGALIIVAAIALLCLFASDLLRPYGLAVAHFEWSASTAQESRRLIRTLTLPLLIAVFIAWAVELTGNEAWKESLGRLAFIVAMIILFIAIRQIFRGNHSLASRMAMGKPRVVRPERLRIASVVISLIPILLIAGALSGYYYTALRVGARLLVSVAVVFVVIVASAFVYRWLKLGRRKLARTQAEMKRKKLKKQKAVKESELAAAIDEESIDLQLVDTQNRRLIRSTALLATLICLWFAWADMVPALGVLDQIEIGSTMEMVTEVDPTVDGEDATVQVERPVPITLQHLAIAIVIAVVTTIAARNIPGVLEIAVLRRMELAAGERYAVTTIFRYALIMIGIVLVFNAIGVAWSRVQWLVAALGVGLGFGLQEIFANFMSGLILLFERPIRLGDTVTIGGVHGTVTRIRIRATTVTDFDRKELVVPNKEFVTGQLVNWTLSDSVLRQIIPVGVSYSSDIDEVVETLRNVAHKNKKILNEPPPQTLFLGFGDNTLNFELRVHCGHMEDYIPLRHELHMEIFKAFHENGIEIAFPQRDLHIRSIEAPLTIMDKREGSSESTSG